MNKKITSLIILTVIISSAFSFAVCGLDIDIDGYTNERAWRDAPAQVLVSGALDSNNSVTYALAACVSDFSSNRLYISLKASSDTAVNADTLHGAQISLDGSSFISLDRSGVTDYDSQLYYIDYALSEYSSNGFCVEICVGVKFGISSLGSAKVRLVDGEGSPSNVYSLNLPVLIVEETTTIPLVTLPTTAVEQTTSSYTNSITTTQKETATDNNDKESTTQKKSEKTTKKKKSATTVKRTTTRRTVTAASADIPANVETTVEKTTQADTTQSESTAAPDSLLEYKEIKYAAAIGLIILIFGLCVIINMNGDKSENAKKD